MPPLFIGDVNPVLKRGLGQVSRGRSVPSRRDGAGYRLARVGGPGDRLGTRHPRTGRVRRLQPGEILVAPMTAPAWTPLFTAPRRS